MPLRHADALRTTDPAAALAAYVSHRDALDPLDADRMLWIALQRGPMLPLLGHLKQAADQGTGDLAIACALAVAGITQDAGDLDASERYYRQVMDATRESDRPTYLRASINLAQTYRSAGRVFECLVLARRAERETVDTPHYRAAARLHVCGAMSDLRDFDALAEAIIALRASVGSMKPGPQRDVLRALAIGYRWEVDRARGAHEDALATLDEFMDAVPVAPHTEHFVIESWIHRADSLLALGRLEEAAQLVQRTRRADLDRPDFLVMLEAFEVQLLVRLEGADAARPWALAFLQTLASTDSLGEGALARFALDLGVLFADELHDVDSARHCFDLAERATSNQAAGLERALLDVPEIGEPDERELATLAAARQRAAEHGEAVRATIAARLSNSPACAR